MISAEIDAMYRAAEAEFDQGETAMLVPPLQIMGVIDHLRRCERLRVEAGAYDQLAD